MWANVDSYSVYVLEAAASNRITYFLPPLVCFIHNPLPIVDRIYCAWTGWW